MVVLAVVAQAQRQRDQARREGPVSAAMAARQVRQVIRRVVAAAVVLSLQQAALALWAEQDLRFRFRRFL